MVADMTEAEAVLDGFKPLAGYALIRLESRMRSTGPIVVPTRVKRVPHVVGEVVSVTMREIDLRALGQIISAGSRVIIAHQYSRHVAGDCYLYPLTFMEYSYLAHKEIRTSGILGIVEDATAIQPHIEDIPRCVWCGSTKSGSKQGMLLVEGYCPRCGKNEAGDVQPSDADASDDDVEEYAEVLRDAIVKAPPAVRNRLIREYRQRQLQAAIRRGEV